jgi:hypothetical protein
MYRASESFCEYVLIAQERVYVERHVRLADGSWRMTESSDRGAVVELSTGGCRLRLEDVYEGAGIAV